MPTEPLFEQPGEFWVTFPTLAVGAFAAVLDTDYFDAEAAAYGNRVGSKFDKVIVDGQVTVGQDGPSWLQVVATESPLADAAAFTAADNVKEVVSCEHGDAGSENPKRTPELTGQGRYLSFRKSLIVTGSAGNVTAVVKARIANFMRGKNYV